MSYILSVTHLSEIYYFRIPDNGTVTISALQQADVVVPNLGHTTVITICGGVLRMKDTAEKGQDIEDQITPDKPYAIDRESFYSICISKQYCCDRAIQLGEEFSLSIGRVKKNDGRGKDIILPVGFVSRMHCTIERNNGKTVITDLHSTNGTYVNGRHIDFAELQPGDVISILTIQVLYSNDSLRFKNTVEEPIISDLLCSAVERGEAGSEQFVRSPRIQERLPQGKIEFPAPPGEVGKPDINWLSTLLPAGVTVAIAVTMALAFKNTMMMLYSLPMTVAGVVVSIVNYKRGMNAYREASEARETTYIKKINEITEEIENKRKEQKRAMLLTDPAPQECLTAAMNRSTHLWSREPDDPDFLSVRIGTGTIPFSVHLSWPSERMGEDDELYKKAEEIGRANTTIDDMPVLCNIREDGVIGVVGMPRETRRQMQNMLFHLVTHHCCTELKIVCLYNKADEDELKWLTGLPHVREDAGKELFIAQTQEEADKLCRSFNDLFKERMQALEEHSSYGSVPAFLPYILFAIFEPGLLRKNDPINRYLFQENGLNIGCLMAVSKIGQLPKQCTSIITVSDNNGEQYNTTRASERQRFKPDMFSDDLYRRMSDELHPLYCDEGIAVNTVPKKYTFFQMLGIKNADEFDIGESWMSSDLLISSLAPSAPFGILENGENIFFNSPPTGENGGSHALVAGTTGSGKSEVLLSIIGSLSLRYSPQEVSFLIIDFKGDSIAGKLTNLPHLRGVITSLDGDELRRSLTSITAENLKRQSIFKNYNDTHPEDKKKISDIRDYTEKYRQGKVTEPLPHLFIIVDEFAEMKKQLPDVMDRFLSVAMTGRSLGVKLILATQSPSGVVDNQIRANIFKQICLKTANTNESRDVIGRELAAQIKEPGRGYLKVDDDIQLFQSAFSGGKYILPDGSESTQLLEVIEAIHKYCATQGIRKLPNIFCPPLDEDIVFPQLDKADALQRSFGLVPIGVRDDPATQFSGDFSMDIFSANTLIVGSQMMGKTNLLQSILRGVATMYSPDEVNIYILDFSSLFLKNFESLPQVGGVVAVQETEKITNLFRMLNIEMEERRQRFIEVGVSTFTAYRQGGMKDLPQILVMVDDLAVAKNYFPIDGDPLLKLCKDGLPLGISIVATATQPVGSTTYLPLFSNRIAMYNNDASVYLTLMGRSSLKPKALPGRCLVNYDNGIYECQQYRAFNALREIDRAVEIREFCKAQVNKASGNRAMPIPFVPRDLTVAKAIAEYPQAYKDGRMMLGIDYATVAPLSVKLSALGMFAISGREKDVINYQRYMLAIAANGENGSAVFYVADGIDRALESYSELPGVIKYSFIPSDTEQMLHEVRQRAEERYARLMRGDKLVLDDSATLVLMLNCSESIAAISSSKIALADWNALTGTLKSMNVCIIFGALENANIPFSSEVLRKFKDNRKLLYFNDIGSLKICDIPYASAKQFSDGLQSGDGYIIIGNDIARIRVPQLCSAKMV